MSKEELYELLDIESPSDFQYFENLASFLECEEELDFADVAELFTEVDKEMLTELAGEYFNEISGLIPDNETEIFMVFENVGRAISGMCTNYKENENLIAKLCEEIERFRRWYSQDEKVVCTDVESGVEKLMSVRDALLAARIEKLDNTTSYEYDFSDCEDYPIDEYIMSMGDIAMAGESEN